jgi:hypothetical protein
MNNPLILQVCKRCDKESYDSSCNSDYLFNCLSCKRACYKPAADRPNEWEEICNSIHYFVAYPLIYCSTALRMNVLRGISPRTLSVPFSNDNGNVIPTFSVLSILAAPLILVLYIVPSEL